MCCVSLLSKGGASVRVQTYADDEMTKIMLDRIYLPMVCSCAKRTIAIKVYIVYVANFLCNRTP